MRHLVAFAILASLPVTIHAQQSTAPAFAPEAFRAHVDFLADDLLEGRDTGSRGYDIAARYVATRFEALGLKPGANGSWYQDVPFLVGRLADAPPTVTIGGRSFANGQDVIVYPTTAEASQSLEAPVVFVGYGLDMPSRGFDDYRGLDVKGKIVAVLSGVPKGTPSEMGAHLNSDKARMAQRRGAVGMVTILTKEATDVYPWARRAAIVREPTLSWVKPDGSAFQRAPGIRIAGTLGMPAAEALFAGARRPISAVLDEAARDGAKPRGFALKPTLRMERRSDVSRMKSPNVLAVLPGSDPALANEYVVLMAHLDHEGVNPNAEGDKVYNGAMDNAAGTATLIEVARAMAAAPDRPKRSILFAAVTAEEKGLLGSEYLAQNPVAGSGKVVGVVNLDMPVLLYDFTDVIAFGSDHSTLGESVARAGAQMNVKLSADPMPEQGIFTRSDHYRFVQERVPSVMLMTGFANGGETIWKDFFARYYHKPADEPGLPFNWDAAAKFARINYLIAREIADAPQAPRWYSDSFFGQAVGGDQSKATRPAP